MYFRVSFLLIDVDLALTSRAMVILRRPAFMVDNAMIEGQTFLIANNFMNMNKDNSRVSSLHDNCNFQNLGF